WHLAEVAKRRAEAVASPGEGKPWRCLGMGHEPIGDPAPCGRRRHPGDLRRPGGSVNWPGQPLRSPRARATGVDCSDAGDLRPGLVACAGSASEKVPTCGKCLGTLWVFARQNPQCPQAIRLYPNRSQTVDVVLLGNFLIPPPCHSEEPRVG